MPLVPQSLVRVFTSRIAPDPELHRQLTECGRTTELSTGQAYLRHGSEVKTFAIVVDGSLRVAKTSDGGREITLYTVGPGECCTVDVLSLLSGRPSPVEVVAESGLCAVLYPRELFWHWMEASAAFRADSKGASHE